MSDPQENLERETISQLYDEIEALSKGLWAADKACQNLEAALEAQTNITKMMRFTQAELNLMREVAQSMAFACGNDQRDSLRARSKQWAEIAAKLQSLRMAE